MFCMVNSVMSLRRGEHRKTKVLLTSPSVKSLKLRLKDTACILHRYFVKAWRLKNFGSLVAGKARGGAGAGAGRGQ
jgi:hypothetical protein